jgi:hypothetical protein
MMMVMLLQASAAMAQEQAEMPLLPPGDGAMVPVAGQSVVPPVTAIPVNTPPAAPAPTSPAVPDQPPPAAVPATPAEPFPTGPVMEAPASAPSEATPASAPAAEEGAAAAAPLLSADAPTNKLSFGDVSYSLLFGPSQVRDMKSALNDYETRRIESGEEVNLSEGPVVEPPAPSVYPVYRLGSVAFRNAGDWTVWVNGARITPKTNDQPVKVVAVGRDIVRFQWTPPYLAALRERQRQNKFVATDTIVHKLTRPNTALFDPQSGQVYFTLRPNQSFAAGYMATFEGTIPSPALEPLFDAAQQNAPAEGGAATGAASGNAGYNNDPTQQLNAESTGLGGDQIREMYQRAQNEKDGVRNSDDDRQNMDTLLQNQQNSPIPNNRGR